MKAYYVIIGIAAIVALFLLFNPGTVPDDVFSIDVESCLNDASAGESISAGSLNWTDQIQITRGEIGGFPTIAADTQGDINLVWNRVLQYSKSTEDMRGVIYYKKINKDGKELTKNIIITKESKRSFDPQLALDSSGNIHVLWSDFRNDKPQIYYKKLSSCGKELVKDTLIADVEHAYSEPMALAVDSSDNVLLAWIESADGFGQKRNMYYEKFDNNGKKLTEKINIGIVNSFSSIMRMKVDSGGNIHLFWGDSKNKNDFVGGYGWYHKKINDRGESLSNDAPVGRTYKGSVDLSVAVDLAGNIHAIWPIVTRSSYDGTNVELFYKKLNNNGTNITQVIQITNSSRMASSPSIALEASASNPSFAFDSAGKMHLVWQDSRTGAYQIYYKELDDNGNNLTGDVQLTKTLYQVTYTTTHYDGSKAVNEETVRNTSYTGAPSIAVDINGNLHVAWLRKDDVYYKRHNR